MGSNKKQKQKAKKEQPAKNQEKPQTKKTSDTPTEGIPDVDFKKFLGCG